MLIQNGKSNNVVGTGRLLFIGLLAFGLAVLCVPSAVAQSPSPSPSGSDQDLMGGYKVTAVVEFGWRWRSLDGNVNKYRSDLNYKPGFRSFDSNILLQSDTGKGKYFDSLLISNSGWGADPNGFLRVNMEKIGIYKLNTNVRRINYFNNLSNHALNQHTQNTNRDVGDFDITFLPQNELIRFTAGGSWSKNKGPGFTTARAYGDEFPISSRINAKSNDFRVGAEGKLLGFGWGLTQGFRVFKERSYYELTAPHQGNNPVGTAALATFSRSFPIDGQAYFTSFNLHRTIAEKLDFTGRVIYSNTSTTSSMLELISGRDASNNFIDLDRFTISGDAKRPQTRADIGLTYNVTRSFRISNTFSLDTFAVHGGEFFHQEQIRRNAAGTPLSTVFAQSAAYRVTAYKRYVNTIEGDYQFNNRLGVHIGYRYTHRKVDVTGYDLNLRAVLSATNPRQIIEDEKNGTNTLIAGMKIKPVKNWSIFWDVEHGQADNVFTRVENYKFTNFRVRSKVSVNKFSFDFSAITKNNSNPSVSVTVPSGFNYVTDVRSRVFSGSATWDPISELSIGGGYTYRRLTSFTPVIFPVQITPPTTTVSNFGFSQFFMRDHYGYVEMSARPHKRVSLFATYRMNKDTGQGDLVSAVIANTTPNTTGVFQNVIGSYPIDFRTPEFRIAFRLHRNVDWNVGYQYYNFKDIQTPTQNYRAHLPFTSLRIYFGNGAADR